MRKVANKDMYSAMAQSIRIEWETVAGGVLKPAFNIYKGGSKTEHVQDVQAIITEIDTAVMPQIQFLDSHILTNSPAIIKIETDVNLKNMSRFMIAQKITNNEWGSLPGSGSVAVWTPSADPSWTADQWKGYWLWFSDRRFEVLSNTTTALTVNLRDQALPTLATNAYILGVQEWYPVFNDQSVSNGLRTLLGTEQLWQAILCTKIPVPGDQV